MRSHGDSVIPERFTNDSALAAMGIYKWEC
jgi:hypothetical protein